MSFVIMSSRLVIFLTIFLALSAVASARLLRAARAFGDWEIDNLDLPRELVVTFRIALAPRNVADLEFRLNQVANPSNEKYRNYLSRSALRELVSPLPTEIDRAILWLQGHGAKKIEPSFMGDWLTVDATVSTIESMFSTKLSKFRNRRTAFSKIATSGTYSIPDSVSDIIQLVAGMNTFTSARAVAIKSPPATGIENPAEVTPDTIYTVYGTDSSGSRGSKLGSQAVIEFGTLSNFNELDLQEFFKEYQPHLYGETCGVAYGTNNGNIRGSVEANLDVQYIMAAGVYVNTTTYKITSSYKGESIEDEFLEYTWIVSNQTEPALVHSISYGAYGGEYDNETDHRFSYELMKMGISGISVLLASGDNGVGCNKAGTEQEFDYPDSPYITMVGATYLDSRSGKEIGATLSSGGFSKNFMQAEWQADAVNEYLNSNVQMPSESFYAPGRAYPDISAFGQNVLVWANGESIPVSGTSCSAPIFAGVIALINHELMSRGQPPLGFLNPWLYSNPSMFTDITEGSNPYQKCDGFLATTGWDPVTGLGTPIYPKMLDYALSSYSTTKAQAPNGSGTCSCTQYGGGYCSGFCNGDTCPCMNCQYMNQTCY